MRVGIPRELEPGEHRVAATPKSVRRLIEKLGFHVQIEAGAGESASLPDRLFVEAGAEVVADAWAGADVVLKIDPPIEAEIGKLRPDLVLISMAFPAENKEIGDAVAATGATWLGLDQVPRISRAQKMDVLSSMANIAGYRAVIEAASHYGSFFNAQMTAAGKTPPARVLVIGAGVAGLAAIAAARGLGAEVRAFDTRMEVKEQVESLGGKFLMMDFEEAGDGGGGYARVMSKEFIEAEMALFRQQAPEIDVVITTALIPGRQAPILWTTDMVETMKPGSVVVDLAARNGGNCEKTLSGEIARHAGVTILGHTDLTSRLPTTASQFFAQNLVHLLDDMGGAGDFRIDHDDEVVRGALIIQDGEWMWPPPKREPPPAPAKAQEAAPAPAEAPPAPANPQETAPATTDSGGGLGGKIAALAGVIAVVAVGQLAPGEFIEHLTVFVLACFVGWQVVWNVTAALHTPLMSVTNAISGIILVGGILQASTGSFDAASILGAVAVLVATINIAGGFLVTQRMLRMFQRG